MKEELLKELDEIYNECKNIGWNYGGDYPAYPISLDVVNIVKEYIKHIKTDIKPNIKPYNSGNIGLEWLKSNRETAIIIFTENGNIDFSILSEHIDSYGSIKNNKNIIFIPPIEEINKIF